MSILSRWKLLSALLAIFIAGGVVGGVATYRVITRFQHERLDQRTWTPRTLRWLAKEGDLSPAQIERLRPRVDAAMHELAGLRDRATGEFRDILTRMLIAISGELDAVQRDRIRQALAALEAARAGQDGPDAHVP